MERHDCAPVRARAGTPPFYYPSRGRRQLSNTAKNHRKRSSPLRVRPAASSDASSNPQKIIENGLRLSSVALAGTMAKFKSLTAGRAQPPGKALAKKRPSGTARPLAPRQASSPPPPAPPAPPGGDDAALGKWSVLYAKNCVVTKLHGAFKVQILCAQQRAGVLLNMLSKFWGYPDPVVGYRAGHWFGLASLPFLSYPVHVTLKSCKAIPVVIGERLLTDRRHAPSKYLGVIAMCVGASAFVVSAMGDASDKTTTARGVGLVGCALVADGLYGGFQTKLVPAAESPSCPLRLTFATRVKRTTPAFQKPRERGVRTAERSDRPVRRSGAATASGS